MKLFSIIYRCLGVIIFCILLSDASGQNAKKEIPIIQTRKTCGLLCLEKVYETINGEKLAELINYNPINFKGLMQVAKQIGLEPNSVQLSLQDLETIGYPAIMHFKNEHFVVLLESDNEMFKIYDPLSGNQTVDPEYLGNQWSGKTMAFNPSTKVNQLDLIEGKFTFGFTNGTPQGPPQGDNTNGTEPRGDPTNSNSTANCGGNGAPVLSVTPITLNVTAQDIPLWYSTGIGPDIEIKLTYNASEKNVETGIGNQSTNFYPLGKMWTLNYASFYSLKTNSDVLVVGADGRHDLYAKTTNPQIPYIIPLGRMLKIFPVTTGYTFVDQESKYKYHYNSPYHSKVTSIEDRNGNTVSFEYDPNTFNLTKITDAQGRQTTIITTNGKITEIHDPFNRIAKFEYTGDYLTKITDMAGYVSIMTYNTVPVFNGNTSTTEMRLISLETPTGLSTIDYEIINTLNFNVEYNRITITNADGNKQIYSWWPQSTTQGITKFVDYNGNEYQYYINITDLSIEKVIYPQAESSVFYGYHSNGIKNSITVGQWVTLYEFDDRRNIIKVTDPRGKITQMTYDDNDNLTTIHDPMNRITTFDYDDHDNLIEITTPVNNTGFSYYSNGNLKDVTDPRGFVTSYTYDGNYYLTQITYPQGGPSIFINDDLGRPTSVTTNGVTVNNVYNNLNQVTLISFPDGTSVSNTYDFWNLISTTDRGGRTTDFEYECGTNCFVRSSIGPQGTIVSDRDANGNVLNYYINGVSTSYQYDDLERVLKMTNPDGTSKHYTYDELGNLLTRLDENRTLTTYSYNYSLLTQTDYADDTPDVEYTYNNNGEVTSMTDVTGTTSYTYDNGGRLTYINRPGTEGDMTYTYDNAGNRLSMNIPGMEVNYTYDSLNRLVDVESDYGTAAYQYDSKGNLKKKTYGNGTFTDYSYDELNRLVSLQNKKSTQEIFSGFNYTYDEASMIKTILDNEGNLSAYNYDYAYQLTEEKVEDVGGHILWHDQFTYDNMGNRLTQNKNGIIDYYENNINNQLTSLKRQSNNVTGFIYGDTAVKVYVNNIQANLTIFGDTLVKFIAKDIPLEFASDTGYFVAYANGALAQVGDSSRFIINTKKYPTGVINILVTNDTTGIPAENINQMTRSYETIHYNYDPNGNLVARFTPFDTTNYFFDAENRLTKVELPGDYFEEYEYDGLWQRTSSMINGTQTRNYTYDNAFEAIKIVEGGNSQYLTRGLNFGGGIGGLISNSDNLNGITYNHFNHRGDVINILNSNQSVVSKFNYSAFGNIKFFNGADINRFKYSTKEYEPFSELSNFGYRNYSDEGNRWISRDPFGHLADMNLYRFCRNNSINFFDPDGRIVVQWAVVETAIDFAFLVYDINQLRKNPRSWENLTFVVVDVVFLAVPVIPNIPRWINFANVVVRYVTRANTINDIRNNINMNVPTPIVPPEGKEFPLSEIPSGKIVNKGNFPGGNNNPCEKVVGSQGNRGNFPGGNSNPNYKK